MTSFPGKPDQASTKKAEPFWILTKQGMMGWQWHQLEHMQSICTSLQTNNHTNTSLLSFLWARCFSWCPANSVCRQKTNQCKPFHIPGQLITTVWELMQTNRKKRKKQAITRRCSDSAYVCQVHDNVMLHVYIHTSLIIYVHMQWRKWAREHCLIQASLGSSQTDRCVLTNE